MEQLTVAGAALYNAAEIEEIVSEPGEDDCADGWYWKCGCGAATGFDPEVSRAEVEEDLVQHIIEGHKEGRVA